MDMLDKMADIFFHPAQAVWSIFAIPGSFFLAFISLSNTPLAIMYTLLGILCLAGSVSLPTTFKNAAQNSVDWNEETPAKEISLSWLLGLISLLVSASVIGILAQSNINPFLFGLTSLLWVPQKLSPFATSIPFYNFMVAAFATVFAVIPGEESLKTLFTPLYKAYEHTSLAHLPFALQPAIVVGVAFWAALHITLNQQPWFFFFTAFLAGEIMMWMSARAGTYLVSWLIHTAWNLLVLALVTGA